LSASEQLLSERQHISRIPVKNSYRKPEFYGIPACREPEYATWRNPDHAASGIEWTSTSVNCITNPVCRAVAMLIVNGYGSGSRAIGSRAGTSFTRGHHYFCCISGIERNPFRDIVVLPLHF
jgi:hypothetical protein